MLLELGGETLIARAWRLACLAFGEGEVQVAIPVGDKDWPLFAELVRIGANVFTYDGEESDVLGRFWYCAHTFRWHPDSVIHRWTPDDPFKAPHLCRLVAEGARYPVVLGGEAFTLAQLDRAYYTTNKDDPAREHIGNHRLLWPIPAPPCPAGIWTVDTPEQYEQALQRFASQQAPSAIVRPVVPGVAHPEITSFPPPGLI